MHLVIDAAYGTGFRGDYRAPAVPAGVPVLAVDIPSGVDGDTGAACGEPLRADVTVTFAALKPGLLQGEGAALAGRVEVADIGLDTGDARMWLVDDADVARLLAPRPRDAHKWQSAVAVVAGSPGMTGAAALCARAAYRAGAGMVRLGVPGASGGDLPVGEAVGTVLPALGVGARCPGHGRALQGHDHRARAWAGPEHHRRGAGRAAPRPVPVVVDADGLFALGSGDELPRRAGYIDVVVGVLGTRRASSPPMTVSSPGCRGRPRGPTAWRRRPGWRRAAGRSCC